MTLEEWRRRDDLKAGLAAVLKTEAMREAIELLRIMSTPFLAPNDTTETRSVRQAFQAGVHSCIKLLQDAPTFGIQATRSDPQPWDWIANSNDQPR